MTSTITQRGASPEAIRRHYDVANEFYDLWLDPTLCYSCALWDDDEPDSMLEQAQLRKIDFHANQIHAKGAQRVLDVGCGWGSLVRRLVETHQVEQAIGLTLSNAQAEWSAQLPDPRNVKNPPDTKFFFDVIFPESVLPTLADIIAASDGLFEVVNLRNDREHYARTCQIWYRTLVSRKSEALKVVDLDVYNRFVRYLKLSSFVFNASYTGLLRIGFRRWDERRIP